VARIDRETPSWSTTRGGCDRGTRVHIGSRRTEVLSCTEHRGRIGRSSGRRDDPAGGAGALHSIVFGRSLRLSRNWLGRACIGAASVLQAAGCSEQPQGVDLIRSSRARLAEAWAGGLGPHKVRAQIGKPQRIQDGVRAALPAAPPSRFRFVADVPAGGRLVVAAGIPGRYNQASAVEFVVNVRDRGRERTVLSRLVDPVNRPADRGWVPLEADLSGHAGRGVEIVLETRGFEKSNEPDRAFWGTPTITTAHDAGAPLVIVYLVDTLRADHLPLYGYSRDTGPELERFAQDAVVFDQAIASSSWTKPSVASLFTSLLPRDHGCVEYYTALDPALVTLAERLHGRGYATGAVVANPLVQAKNMHFDQGFDQFGVPPSPRRAEQVVDAALSFVDARRGQPTFLYVHTMDTHTPYQPPPPFDRMFPPFPEPGRSAAEPNDYVVPLDLDRIVGQYDGAIAYGDREFGRLVRGLRERRLYDRATIVFLSDHGEEFLDHGGFGHGHTVFDELVHVPLVVKYPGRREAGRRVARQVQLLDVLPTILKSQGLPVPSGIAGRPLEKSFSETGAERPAVFETKGPAGVAGATYGARTGEAKYVRDLSLSNRELFFDLRRDPREKRGHDPEAISRAQALKRVAEASVSPPAYHLAVRIDGSADYDVRLRTTGWIDIVQSVGFLSADRAQVLDGGHVLALRLGPKAGQPRQVEFAARPHGVPVLMDGTRGGHRLRPSEIRVAAEGSAAQSLPFLVPGVEELLRPFTPPPRAASGVSVWFVPANPGRGDAPLDPETRETLKALGYVH
jgi:arylsulfatase A-like enzyme